MFRNILNNKGLSFVEVIMSALAVGIILAGLYAAYSSANNMVSLAFHKAAALVWAESIIENQKHGFSGSITDPGTPNYLTQNKTGSSNMVTTTYSSVMSRYTAEITWIE